jgi:enamine deaminase RidA (YjgF/YER057c/UK114 family)
MTMERIIVHTEGTREFYTRMGVCEAVRIGNLVHVSGQVGWDAELKPAEGFEAQVRQAFANMAEVLAKAGASVQDIVDMRMFVVQQPGMTLMEMIDTAFCIKKEMMPGNVCAATGLGTAALVIPELIIECAAVAQIG